MKKARSKITSNLIKNFIGIIIIIAILCFVFSSLFLSNLYIKQQYNNLKTSAQNIYDSIKNNTPYTEFQVNAAIVKNNKIIPLFKPKHLFINLLKKINLNTIKGQIQSQHNEKMIYYILTTDAGKIIVFKNYKDIVQYKKIIYITLFSVFTIIILITIPLILYIGNKLTKPILKLEKASKELAKGNFETDLTVDTKDEIHDLSISLKNMSKKLKEKSSLQREFIANVSHDFKTPLSIIRNFAEAIYDGLITENKCNQYSQNIIEEVDILNKMVVDVLNLSKLQEGNINLNLSIFNIKDWLNNCKNKFNLVAKQKNISIQLISVDTTIEGDYNLLSRVLYNFLDNAIKFSRKNSTVELSAVYIDKNIKVSIKNYGEGIKEDILENIWDRYYKNNKSGGMGLGLPICKEILKIHNFKYGIINKEGIYTKFYFLVPV